MSDDADLDRIGAVIEHRLATLFRELCRRELLGDEETEVLVQQATHRPAALSICDGDVPTPQLRNTSMGR